MSVSIYSAVIPEQIIPAVVLNPVTEIHMPDGHATFHHRMVTADDGTQMMICVSCGHWTKRIVPSCTCRTSCHAEARAEIMLLKVYRFVAKSKPKIPAETWLNTISQVGWS